MIRRLTAILITLFLSACSSPSAKNCQEADWYEIGRRDGAKGQLLDERQANRPGICTDTNSEDKMSLYLNGRNAGLVEYCKPENGYELGKEGKTYNQVCPPGDASNRFLQFYEKGRRVRKLKEENQSLNRKISDLFDQINRIEARQAVQLDQELTQLRKKRASNNREMSTIQVDLGETL